MRSRQATIRPAAGAVLGALALAVAQRGIRNRRRVTAADRTRDIPGRQARHERLRSLHAAVLQLVLHESRFVLERTNSYLVANSLLLTGFFVALSQQGDSPAASVLTLALPVFGLVLSAVQPVLIARTITALEFWRTSLVLIEGDNDYWFPAKRDADIDLDITSARGRYWRGEPTRQEAALLRFGSAPRFILRFQRYLVEPNRYFLVWLPTLLASLWTAALVLRVLNPS